MNYINTNTDYSETSYTMNTLGTETSVQKDNSVQQNQSGGFFSIFSSPNDNLLMKACVENEPRVMCFMIENNMVANYNICDNDGKTLLHYLCIFWEAIGSPNNEKLLKSIVSKNRDLVNKCDKNGNTPLHISCQKNFTKLTNMLLAHGAKRVPNKNGDVIVTDNDTEFSMPAPASRKFFDPNSDTRSVFIKRSQVNSPQRFSSTSQQSDTFREMAKNFKITPFNSQQSMTSELSASIDTANYLRNMNRHVSQARRSNSSSNDASLLETSANSHKSDTFDELLNSDDDSDSTVTIDVHKDDNGINVNIDVDVNNRDRQYGGNKNVIYGSRKVNVYGSDSEHQYGRKQRRSSVNSATSSMSMSSTNSSSKSRTPSKTDIEHQETIELIMKLMNVGEEDAKVYKGYLYRKVKEEHPELNGFDRAVEMKKLAKVDTLKKVDIDSLKNRLSEDMKKRAESNSSSIDISTTINSEKSKKETSKKSKKVARQLNRIISHFDY